MNQPASTAANTQPTQRQRLMSFTAANARSIFPIAQTFADRFGAAYPSARDLLPLNSKTSRYHFATAVAAICKNIDGFGAGTPEARAARRMLASRGITSANAPVARACFIASMRQHAGDTWTRQIEQDWTEVADRFLTCTMPAQTAAAAPMRMAA